jgi:hypothetical protein
VGALSSEQRIREWVVQTEHAFGPAAAFEVGLQGNNMGWWKDASELLAIIDRQRSVLVDAADALDIIGSGQGGLSAAERGMARCVRRYLQAELSDAQPLTDQEPEGFARTAGFEP